MTTRFGLLLSVVCVAVTIRGHAQETVPLTQGIVIDRSVTIRPGTYRLSASADLKAPALTIGGESLVVDFNGATLIGSAEISAAARDYTLQVISDDGVRVWVDGKLALDAWAPHESRVDFVQLNGGRRRLRVEYYEATGWAEIRLDVQPRRTRN